MLPGAGKRIVGSSARSSTGSLASSAHESVASSSSDGLGGTDEEKQARKEAAKKYVCQPIYLFIHVIVIANAVPDYNRILMTNIIGVASGGCWRRGQRLQQNGECRCFIIFIPPCITHSNMICNYLERTNRAAKAKSAEETKNEEAKHTEGEGAAKLEAKPAKGEEVAKKDGSEQSADVDKISDSGGGKGDEESKPVEPALNKTTPAKNIASSDEISESRRFLTGLAE